MITDVSEYFTLGCGRCERFDTPDCSTRQWGEGLRVLRALCVDLALVETAKWGHPCYMHAGRNIAIIGALRGDFRLSFFNAALMKDPEKVLERQGPNTQHPDMLRFTSNAQVEAMRPSVRAYLQEAMSYAAAGLRPPKEEAELELPSELIDAMAADPELGEAFQLLTPGRQRSYVIHLSSTKKSETRLIRIARLRPHILAGKGALER
ncbi:MAG: YdeI/OmpD-associated family protein [Bradymonadia bacterium]